MWEECFMGSDCVALTAQKRVFPHMVSSLADWSLMHQKGLRSRYVFDLDQYI